MFQELEGPTALRADMIQALAFSVGEAELDTEIGRERCIAALAAVWNGKRGFVAVLVGSRVRARVRRYAWSEAIRSVPELVAAVESAMGLGASLGFFMDDPDFARLGADERAARLERWNGLRKSRGIAASSETEANDASMGRRESAAQPSKEPAAPPPDLQTTQIVHDAPGEPARLREPEDLTVVESVDPFELEIEAEALSDSFSDQTPRGAILGRIALVRHDDTGERATLLGRLLAFF